ncbi:MAG: pilus assembly protein PilM [Terrimicrobiaceae bacterium]
MALKSGKTIISIDVGIDSMKAVLLGQEGDEFQCLGTMVKQLSRDTDTSASFFEGIKDVYAKFGRHSKRAVLVIPERMVQYKFIDKPEMPLDQLRHVVDNEMKMTLPSAQSNIATVENDKIDYLYASLGQIVSGNAKKNHLMSVFASLSSLNDLVTLFKKAGLSLEGAYTIPQVIHEFLTVELGLESEETPGQVAVINLGASANYLTVSRGKTLMLGRSFPFAGDEINKELVGVYNSSAQAVDLKIADAENYKKVVGILSPEEMSGYENGSVEIEVSHKIRALIGQAMQKIRLALEYIKTQEGIPVTKIVLSGGGATMRGILDTLREVFTNAELVVADPFSKIKLSPVEPEFAEIPPEHLPLFVQALGAGICAIKLQPQMIDLINIVRRERALIRAQFIQKYVPLIAIIVTGVTALGAYYQFWYKDFVEKKASLMRSLSMTSETYQPMQNFKPELDTVMQEKLAIEGKIGLINALMVTRVKWSKFFLTISKLIPDDVWLESFSASRIGPTTVQITMVGKSSSMTLVNQFQQRLQSSAVFNQIEWRGSKNAGEGTVFGFTFVGELASQSATLK